MEKLILSKLQEIEKAENVRILFAVESGSRAWGFASPDSDYDVRFVYVRAKKYFYVLRPILACRWIFEKGTYPPMLFSELMQGELPDELLADVEMLLVLKVNSPELKLIPKIDRINEYLDSSIKEFKTILQSLNQDKPADWSALNQLFLEYID